MLKTTRVRKYSAIITLTFATLLLQGCGNKVDCNGSKVKNNAIEIIQSHLNTSVWYKEMGIALSGEPELNSIQTINRNDDLKQAQCSGKYTFIYNGKPREVDVAYDLAYLQDKGETEVKVDVDAVKSYLIALIMTEHPVKNR